MGWGWVGLIKGGRGQGISVFVGSVLREDFWLDGVGVLGYFYFAFPFAVGC